MPPKVLLQKGIKRRKRDIYNVFILLLLLIVYNIIGIDKLMDDMQKFLVR
jgi:hypothetical protein